jgi:methanogenic corrinoid protein MtbC1
MAEIRHSIKAVARKTGLSTHVIRVWERRYKAVQPSRTDTNRRLYSEADVERLGLLKQATQAGHSIGTIADLPMDRLMRIAAEAAVTESKIPPAGGGGDADQFIEDCLTAIRGMNSRALDDCLGRALVRFGHHGLLEKVIGVLAQRVGELWRAGEILAAHEHFASAAIRGFLSRNSQPFPGGGNLPTLVVGTPAGQLHELGAVMVAAAANDLGWRVVYLGPSLPAGELAAAVAQNQARAVALSLVYPEDDPHLPVELENLRRYLPSPTAIIAGGRAAPAYATTLKAIGALQPRTLSEFYTCLERLRANAARE